MTLDLKCTRVLLKMFLDEATLRKSLFLLYPGPNFYPGSNLNPGADFNPGFNFYPGSNVTPGGDIYAI